MWSRALAYFVARPVFLTLFALFWFRYWQAPVGRVLPAQPGQWPLDQFDLLAVRVRDEGDHIVAAIQRTGFANDGATLRCNLRAGLATILDSAINSGATLLTRRLKGFRPSGEQCGSV